MDEIHVDIAARECGSWFGGELGKSKPCPKCSRPACLAKKRIKSGDEIETWSHGFVIRLNDKNEPECHHDMVCTVKGRVH